MTLGQQNESCFKSVHNFIERRKDRLNKIRKQQEHDFKKNLIVSAAEEIFYTKGFEGTTMLEIANKAGYSKGSIYSYFKSKNEVCFCIINNYFGSISQLAQTISQEKTSGLKKLITFKDKFLIEFSQKEDFRKIFETFKYHKNQCQSMEDEIIKNRRYNTEINNALKSFIEEGKIDGSLKSSVKSELLADALWGENESFISELGMNKENRFNYLFELIIDSITQE